MKPRTKNDRRGVWWEKLLPNYLQSRLLGVTIVVWIIGLFIWVQPALAAEIEGNFNSIVESLAIEQVKGDNCLVLTGEKGITACQRLIAINPQNINYWNNLGSKYFYLGRYRDALTAYDRALSIEPHYSLGLANKCGVLSVLGKYQQALDSCNLALQGNSKWGLDGAALAWDNRGDVLFNLKRYRESLSSFERALSLNPNYQNARKNHTIVLAKLKPNRSVNYDDRLHQLIRQRLRAKSVIGFLASFCRSSLDDAGLGYS